MKTAEQYLREYTGSHPFLVSVAERVHLGRSLTEKQEAAVQRFMTRDASFRTISQALTAGRVAKPAPRVTEAGMYQHPDGRIFKVQKAVHGSGRLYAKLLVPPREFGGRAEFKYTAGAIFELNPDMQMTMAQAKAFGALYGTCCNCGATLTNEKSIELGIGPVCRKWFQ